MSLISKFFGMFSRKRDAAQVVRVAKTENKINELKDAERRAMIQVEYTQSFVELHRNLYK